MKKIIKILQKPGSFIKRTLNELRQVEWLRRRMLFSYSIYVLVFLVVGILLIFIIDNIFALVRNILIPG